MITSILPQDPGTPARWKHWQLPEQASTFASEHDALYTFVEWINYIFFFGIMAVLFYAVIKYRRKTPDQEPVSTITHHTAMEVTWTVIPLILVMVIFAWGWKGYSEMTLAPADAIQYEVKGKRWEWAFKHPGERTFVTREFWVPVNTPVQLTMSSVDVLHSFYIPAFRVKRDVLPGRFQTLWFQATHEGDYNVFCTEFCGDGHSKMVGTVHVVSQDLWQKYLEGDEDRPWDPYKDGGEHGIAEMPTDEEIIENLKFNGRLVYNRCSACHSLDGVKSTGPSFKGLWERNAKRLADGKSEKEQYTAVAKYIYESIRNPNAYIVEGYKMPSEMTMFSEKDLPDERVKDIIGFLKFEELK